MTRPTPYRSFAAAILLLCAVGLGCRDFAITETGGTSLTVVEGIDAFPDQPFELAIGETARVDTFQLAIRFALVPSDTRCPLSVDCTSSGLGQVLADLYADSGEHTQFILTIPGQVGLPYTWGNEVQIGDRRFRLTRLDPYPDPGMTIDMSDYRATIVVQSF